MNKYFFLLISLSLSAAYCIPVIQQEVNVISEKNIIICNSPDKITNIAINNDSKINSSNKTCKDCEILVHLIEHQLNTANKTIEDIITLVRDVCQKINSPSGKECIIIINNINEIIKWITNGQSFQQICHKLNLCFFQKETKNFIRNS